MRELIQELLQKKKIRRAPEALQEAAAFTIGWRDDLTDCMYSLLVQYVIINNNNQRRHFEDDVCLEF